MSVLGGPTTLSSASKVALAVVGGVAVLGAIGVLRYYLEQPTSPPRSGPRSHAAVIHVTNPDTYFDAIKKPLGSVVVDFSAEWCGPCKAITPVFEELASKYPQVTFLHVDIDEMKDSIPEAASVRSVPTFTFYKDGTKVAVFSGADAATLRAHVARIV